MAPAAYAVPAEALTRLVGTGVGQPSAGQENRLIAVVWFFCGVVASFKSILAPPAPIPPPPFRVTTVNVPPRIGPFAVWVTSLAEGELEESPAVMIVTLPV